MTCSSEETTDLIHIKNWGELKLVPPSSTHKLVIEDYYGWIESLTDPKDFYYLSTQTFHETHYQDVTKKLQEYGFNVILESWK